MRRCGQMKNSRAILNNIINFLRKISIYKRLIYSYALIIVISTLVLGTLASAISTRAINTHISKSTQLMLSNLTENLNSQLGTYESLVNQLSYNSKLLSLLKESRDLYAGGTDIAAGGGDLSADSEDLTADNSDLTADNSDLIADSRDFAVALSMPGASREYQDNKREIGNILYSMTVSRKDITNLEILTDYDEFTQLDFLGNARGVALIDPDAYRGSAFFQTVISAQGTPIWSDTSKNKAEFRYSPSVNMGYYLTLAKSIPSRDSTASYGVIIMTVPLTIFDNFADLHELYDRKEVVFLAGEKGIVAILNNSFPVKSMPDQKTAAKITSMKEGTLTYHDQGTKKDMLLFFSPCGKINLSIVYMVPNAALFSSIYLIRKVMVTIILVCIVFSIILAFFVTKSISMPLKSLQYVMSQTGDNDLQAVYEDTQKDEIGFLGSQFNEMMHRIQELLKRLIKEENAYKNEQIKRKEAELNALQMSINPHFIYNTLDLIRWNAMFAENGNGKVSQMLAAFSKLLRFNIKYMDTLVTMEEELEHVRAYINVINFKDNFNAALKIDLSEASILKSRLPKLTLQPLVENAVKHGTMEYGADISVDIAVVKADGRLTISICDDGCGMEEEQVREINDDLNTGRMPRSHIGLRNVNERIRLSFGESYGLRLESRRGEYTRVIICIPDTGITVQIKQ